VLLKYQIGYVWLICLWHFVTCYNKIHSQSQERQLLNCKPVKWGNRTGRRNVISCFLLFIAWMFYKVAPNSNFTIILSVNVIKFYKTLQSIYILEVYFLKNKVYFLKPLQKLSHKGKCLECIKESRGVSQ
jgi:hypothetical protein